MTPVPRFPALPWPRRYRPGPVTRHRLRSEPRTALRGAPVCPGGNTITAATTGLVTEAAREGEPFGFCLASGGPGELRLRGQLLRGEPEGRGQGVPAHRDRRVHPLGLRGHRARTGAPGPTPVRFIDQRAPPLPAPGGDGAEPCSATTVPNTRPRSSGPTWSAKEPDTTCASRPAPPTTTRCASASTAPSWRSVGDCPSIAGVSPRSASSRPKLMADLGLPHVEGAQALGGARHGRGCRTGGGSSGGHPPSRARPGRRVSRRLPRAQPDRPSRSPRARPRVGRRLLWIRRPGPGSGRRNRRT